MMTGREMTTHNVKRFYREIPDELDVRAKTALVWENMGALTDRKWRIKCEAIEAKSLARDKARQQATIEAIERAWK